MEDQSRTWTRSYSASLIGNIRQILTGLQGFEAMAREIIQNADDAGAEQMIFDIDEDALRISNNGEFSSCGTHEKVCPWLRSGHPLSGTSRACDFHAISTVGSGNKYSEPGLIGRFGIGFVSVYQVTDEPRIRSNTTQLELRPLTEEVLESTIDPILGSEFELPWAFDARSPVRDALNASPLQPADVDTLRAELVTVAEDCLLFLKNLKSIEIRQKGTTLSLVRRSDAGNDQIALHYPLKGWKEDWLVINFDACEAARELREKYPVIDRLDRQTKGQIAFRLGEFEGRVGRLFAYLPTEQDTPIPCHINADFFPEQTRRSLVLSGEQHERHWNEMLLSVAAREVAARLSDLKVVLGPVRLWEMIEEAFEKKDKAHFQVFWSELHKAAQESETAFTADEEWIRPLDCRSLARDTTGDQRKALSKIGIRALNPELARFQNPLSAAGVRQLTAAAFVETYKDWWAHSGSRLEVAQQKSIVEPLWGVVERFLRGDDGAAISRREAWLPLLLDLALAPAVDGKPMKFNELKRLPDSIEEVRIKEFFQGFHFVAPNFSEFPRAYELVDRLLLKDILENLASEVDDVEAASTFFGADKARIRRFYDLLADYPEGEEEIEFSLVEDTPFLIGQEKFLTPSAAVMPGGFVDPVGRFDTLDLSQFSGRARDFLTDRLGVPTLSFEAYVEEHLEAILEDGLTDTQYASLLEQLVAHHDILENVGLREKLAEMSFVWTCDDRLKRPRDCYLRTEEIVEILGDDPALWVDVSRFRHGSRVLYEGFLSELGMHRRPSLTHALDRIEEITSEPPSEEAGNSISRIFGFVFRVYQEDALQEREEEFEDEISRLRNEKWLPAVVDGEPDTVSWYAPHEVYQYFRAGGFESQVPVLGTRRDPRSSVNSAFLEFLEMPGEPETLVVLSHLEHCIEVGAKPNDLVYQILSERLREEDGRDTIARLRDQRVVYAPTRETYFPAGRIFWAKPPVPKYCYMAPDWMHRHKELFDFLGVRDEPDAATYVDVLVEVAEEFGLSNSSLPGQESLIVWKCLGALTDKLLEERGQVSEQLERLRGIPFLSTLNGTLGFLDEVVVSDSDWLAGPFEGALNGRIVRADPEIRDLLRYFDVTRLSEVTSIEVERLGEVIVDEDASGLLQRRAVLLMWLMQDLRTDVRTRVARAFREMKVFRTDDLVVRSVFELTDVPFRTEPRQEHVLYDRRKNELYVHVELDEEFWIPAFKSLYSTLLAGDETMDPRQLALVANGVVTSANESTAKRMLMQAGYKEPSGESTETFEFADETLGEIEEAETHEYGGGDRGIVIAGEDAWSRSIEDEDLIEDDSDGAVGLSPGKASDRHIEEDLRKKLPSGGAPKPTEADGTKGSDGVIETHGARDAPWSRNAPENGSVPSRERNRTSTIRTEYMRSYVMPNGRTTAETKDTSRSSQIRIDEIDAAAMKAVIDYETERSFDPERQPHNNPGYDVISRPKGAGEFRLIEVKGLANDWTERGVKLSRTQMIHARQHGDRYWLYVVENALEPKKRRVHAIQNPFDKADEFWFDHVWKDVADEKGGDQKSRLQKGRRVRVEHWGEGTIEAIKEIGRAVHLTINFRDHGRRLLTYNSSTFEIVEN